VAVFPVELAHGRGDAGTRGVSVSYETICQWALKFGREFANRIRRRAPRRGDKWRLDEVVITIAGTRHWLWRAVDQEGFVLDILLQIRRDKKAAKRMFRKLLKAQGRVPRVLITDNLCSYAAAEREIMPGVEHRPAQGPQQQSGEFPSTDPTTRTDHEAAQVAATVQRFLPIHDQIVNVFYRRPGHDAAIRFRAARSKAFPTCVEVTGVTMVA
jgi:putative transposase